MFTKAQLIEKGRHYFDNKEINIMYATIDGNFFYESSKTYADSHGKTIKSEPIKITRADLNIKSEKVKSNSVPENSEPSELDQLRKEAKKLKIRGYVLMKEETLKKKIAEHGTE